ncbi:MAG: GreA/GreB family elongation factor, partial [Treponema sp.]|nr:GreA/GreB family elongation factor [Treponema sp.]
PTTVTTSTVSFGTKVTLQNNKENKEEVLTIFGPWESDPENGVISYLSPLGINLRDARAGENLKFNINGKDFDYTVKNIAPAQF